MTAIAVAGTLSSARADDVVIVSPVELAAQMYNWEGRTIETTAYCFYVDVAQFRCSSGGVRMDFIDIEPEAARKSLESNCDRVSKACRLRIQFVYDHYGPIISDFRSPNAVVVAKDFKATVVGE